MANWKAVPGYEGRYEVSDEGEVKSLAHLKRGALRNGKGFIMRRIPERLMKLINRHGYRIATLYTNGLSQHWYVHRLVLLAFVGPPQPGQECLHWDDSRSNNHLSNLRWGTKGENTEDAIRNGVLTRDMKGVLRSVSS